MWTVRLVHFVESTGDKLASFAVANLKANSSPLSTCYQPVSDQRYVAAAFSDTLFATQRSEKKTL